MDWIYIATGLIIAAVGGLDMYEDAKNKFHDFL